MWKGNRKRNIHNKSIHSLTQIEKQSRWRDIVQLSTNLKQVVMFWLISVSLVELEIIYERLLVASIFFGDQVGVLKLD